VDNVTHYFTTENVDCRVVESLSWGERQSPNSATGKGFGRPFQTWDLFSCTPAPLEEVGRLPSRKPTLITFEFLAGDQPVKIFRAFFLVRGNPALQNDFTDLGNTAGFLCGNRFKALLQFGLDPKG
jgi:hypothetical protein